MEAAKEKGMLVSPDETIMATIGSNYMQNIIGGQKMKHGYALLTDRRLYYCGKQFSGVGKRTVSSSENCIVSVEDISLTRFIHQRLPGFLLLGFAAFLLGLILFSGQTAFASGLFFTIEATIFTVAIIFMIKYFISRTTLFEISYPGGKFVFDVKWYPLTDMQDFQRQLHLVKDHYKNG